MATSVINRVRALANPARARFVQNYFRTGRGQYGEGDKFLGLSNPQVHALAREFRALPLEDVEKLLESPWHECRLLAVVIMANRFPRATPAEQRSIYQLYVRRMDRVNNWDLVDSSAPEIVGGWLMNRSRAPLRRLAKSKNIWERRIAIGATHPFIRRGQFDDTLAIARILMRDEHDLIHKATGWMLREVGKKDEKVLRAFLDRYAGALPRTALRYSLERLPPAVRKRYMAVPRRPRA